MTPSAAVRTKLNDLFWSRRQPQDPEVQHRQIWIRKVDGTSEGDGSHKEKFGSVKRRRGRCHRVMTRTITHFHVGHLTRCFSNAVYGALLHSKNFGPGHVINVRAWGRFVELGVGRLCGNFVSQASPTRRGCPYEGGVGHKRGRRGSFMGQDLK